MRKSSILTFGLLLWAGAAQAQTGIMDQRSPASGGSPNQHYNANTTAEVWQQTIEVGRAGVLEGIRLELTGRRLSVRLRRGLAPNSNPVIFEALVDKTPSGIVFVDMVRADLRFDVGDLFVLELQGTGGGAGFRGTDDDPTAYPYPLCLNGVCEDRQSIAFTTYVLGCNLNGVREFGEQCDDGNTVPGDGCHECLVEFCGNGFVEPGEVCDDRNNTNGDGCSSDCRSDETCGNGILDPVAGEACDDGNTRDGDGCQSDCSLAGCGDGILDPGEACDDSNNTSGDGCNATCTSDESCGNGVLDGVTGEQCDDGDTTPGDGCGGTCRLEVCGNSIIDPGEVCDDGNAGSGDGCSATCRSDETCGNSVVDGAIGEQCDDGGTAIGDGCGMTCRIEGCGNLILDPGEVCDDGNAISGDGCSATCVSDETCGNRVVDGATGEECDDGGTTAGDGCGTTCRIERCGNNILDPDEICDDGNIANGDGCSATCRSDERCGNGIVDVATGEACDDGNTDDGDGCSASCALPGCGDGILDMGEACDDGNTSSGDGCNRTCTSDESCGNLIVDGSTGEQCDDGNTDPGDGCGASCRIETCGNGVLDPGETCDDGNTIAGDGCASACGSDESCGNGIVDAAAGESCDDGNILDGDGCSSTCASPGCGDGFVDLDELCDDGNNIDGDGCNGNCSSTEECGNRIVDRAAGEMCDEGDENSESGPCGLDCQIFVPMVGADAGPGDAGTGDAGTSDASVDAGTDSGIRSDYPFGGVSGGGCECRIAYGASSRGLWSLLILGLLFVRRRRR